MEKISEIFGGVVEKIYILKTFFRNFVPHDRELYALDWFPTLCAGFRRIYPQNPGCQKFGISKKIRDLGQIPYQIYLRKIDQIRDIFFKWSKKKTLFLEKYFIFCEKIS